MVQFRADKSLKQEGTEIYEVITRNDGINGFYEIRRQLADVPEMSLDEINAEIVKVREERKVKNV